jgi:hypothetical protein
VCGHRLVVDFEVGRHSTRVGQPGGAGGRDREQAGHRGGVLHFAHVGNVASEDRLQVTVEEPLSGDRFAAMGLGEAAGRDPRGVRASSPGCVLHHGRLAREHTVDEALAHAFELPLGERPKADVVDAAGKRVGDHRQRDHVGGAGKQELPAVVARVKAHLDRQDQIGRSLDLVDHRRAGDVVDEARRVLQRAASRVLVVERQVFGRVLVGRYLLYERALAHLPGAEHADSSRCCQGLQDQGLGVPVEQLLAHWLKYTKSCVQLGLAPSPIGKTGPSDWELLSCERGIWPLRRPCLLLHPRGHQRCRCSLRRWTPTGSPA